MVNTKRIRLCAAALGFVMSIGAVSTALSLDPSKTINQSGHDVWLRPNGLPSNAVHSTLVSKDGYIWLGTSAGLFRFDGVQFDEVATDPGDAKNHETISALCESVDSSLWIGTTYSGLRRLVNGTVRTFGPDDGLRERQIRVLFESRAGALWVGTSNGLFKLINGKFEAVSVDQTFFTGITEDTRGRIWVGTHSGVRVFDDRGRVPVLSFSLVDGLPDKITTSLLADRQGGVLIGTARGLVRWKDSTITVTVKANGLGDDHVTTLFEDRGGNLWVGTRNGISRFSNGQWNSFSAAEGLSHNQVLSIAEDHESSIWVGTLEGLNRFKDVNITCYTSRDGIGNDYVSGVFQTIDGTLYILSNANWTLTRIKDGRMTTSTVPIGPAYAARDGSLWIAQTGVLTNVMGESIKRYDGTTGLPAKWISAITEDSQGLIVFLDHTGVFRFVDGKLQPYLMNDGRVYASTEYVECFYPARDGTLWVGTTNGLVRLQNGASRVFGPADGMSDSWVSSIANDPGEGLWISSAHGGLTRYKAGRFTSITTKNGLFTNEIYSVLVDGSGDLWLTSPRGIGRISRLAVEDFESGRDSVVRCQVFTTADGMKTDDCFDEWQPGGLKAQDGRLWFATKKGAVVIDPRGLKGNEVRPPVLIKPVLVNQKPVSAEQLLNLPPGKTSLEIHYTALSYLVPERVLFKYRLEGYDREWVDAGTRRVAFYTNLSPGKYRFHVLACNNDGVWNDTGAQVDFYLTPYFYQTYWFYGTCACLVVLLIFTLVRLRIRSLKARERRLANLVRVRTSELQDQRSFLRKIIDLNPSFIFAKDARGRFTLANRALAQAFGTSVENMLGRTEADFRQRQQEVEKSAQDDLQVMESRTEKFTPEEEFTMNTGEQRWVQVSKIPISSDDGKSLQLLGVATDITLQKTSALEMRKAKEAAEAATRSKSEFLANMSHEIRTPMNAVIGMTGLLLDTELNGEQREFVEIVRTSSDALLTIINDILDFSKIESGKLDLEHQPINLASCIEESLDLLSSKAMEKGIELAYLLDGNTPQGIVGDITRLRQILVNLLSNALKFTHAGEVVVSVTARRLEENQYELEFGVRDTGIGIPQDRMDRLFKSFSQVDSSTTRHFGGTGLGLAISKRLSEMMGGRMWVESKEREGSTFFFTIVTMSAPVTQRMYQRPEQPQLSGKSLLIVDDNATNRRILTLQARSWGMIPEAVSSGPEALEILEKGRAFDLAILDMHMPGMDGAMLSAECRRMHAAQKLPLVMLTSMATSARQLREQYGDLDFAAYLTKPIKPSQLYDVIIAILGDKRNESGAGAPQQKLDASLAKRLPLRILLAEDNVINQKVALRVLERLGYRADVAGNGIEAIEAIERQRYDLIFMDVHMPEMDGLEATKRICNEWPHDRPRIIAMTANALQGDREECLAAGMDGYISKPVRVEELQAILEDLGKNGCKRDQV